MAVALVIVSHSARLADGVVELAGQMSRGDARLIAAGGTDDERLGTSVTKVLRAIEEADSPDGVLILFDLGSARLATEMALEQLSAERRARVTISDAPLVEGAVVAAVEASIGSPLSAVAATAHEAINLDKLSHG
ncbi:MAG TPA: dihydroxyacetone kinase phosphoryl donor subunit DhaM [Ktedonobacterales bacterium]|nr:dihydroxyacetone kinase phosphoryl donor subunit DhaM [Ktedonobacterales bacterium]